MNKDELYAIEELDCEPRLITINDLRNKANRTLLYGYDCNRDSWHVYIFEYVIHTVKYAYGENPQKITVETNNDYIPNKRLHPECCDYEFCTILKSYGIYLPFTQYQEIEQTELYFGKTLFLG